MHVPLAELSVRS